MTKEEREIFFLMDQLKEEEVRGLLGEISGEISCDSSEVTSVIPEDARTRIKTKTFDKLGIRNSATGAVKAANRRWKLWWSVAASFLLVVFFTASMGSERVWATLERALQYVPGMNIVLEDKEQEIERFILEGPIERRLGSGTLKIEGVVVDENNAVIEMSARGLPRYDSKSIYFKDSKGERYYIDSHSMGASTSEWHGTFVYQGNINNREGLKIVVPEGEGVGVELPLVKVKKYASYDELGPTTSVNGISITAIPSLEKEKTRINLLTPPLEDMRIESYGMDPYSNKPLVTLRDSGGKVFDMTHDSSYRGPLNEFYFDTEGQSVEGMTLSIPLVGVELQDEVSVRIWLLEGGEKELNKTVELGGYKVIFERLRRVDDNKVEIDVNVGYDPQAKESLYSFRLDGMSYGAHYDKIKDEGLVTLEFEVEPQQLWVTLDMVNPVIYKKGPWEIKF